MGEEKKIPEALTLLREAATTVLDVALLVNSLNRSILVFAKNRLNAFLSKQ